MQGYRWGWAVLIFANMLVWCMLGFHKRIGAAPQDVRMPFDNAVQQRSEMVRELQEIRNLLKEQNSLLRAGLKRLDENDRTKRPKS